MAKIIKYKFLSCEVDCGTEEEPNVEPIVLDVEIECKTQADLEANLPIAEAEAYDGEYTVVGEFDPEPVPAGEPVTWAELDAAYQEGVESV